MGAARLLPITALVQTKDESEGIRQCVEGLNDFSEVVVVDSNSTDGTPLIAREAGADVVNFTWNGLYPKKKQWQLDNLTLKNDWVFFVDADEFPSPELIAELRELAPILLRGEVSAIDVRIDYRFAGRYLKHGHRVYKRSILRKQDCFYEVVDDLEIPGMGELEGHYQPTVYGKVYRARGRLRHDDPDPVASWFSRHNRYSDWESQLRVRQESSGSIARVRTIRRRLFELVPGRPLIFFLYSYVLRAGFLDGRAGLDYAIALTMYYWQIDLKARETIEKWRVRN